MEETNRPMGENETAVNRRLRLMDLDSMPEWTSSLDAYVGEVTTWPEWSRLRSGAAS